MKKAPKNTLLDTLEPYSRNLVPALKQSKEDMHVTLQDISDATGVPIDFIKKLFTGQLKNRTAFYLVAICIYFDLSIDALFHNSPATTNNPESKEEIAQLKADIRVLEEQLKSKDHTISILDNGIKKRRVIIYGLMILSVLLTISLIGYLSFDISTPAIGYIKNGHLSPVAWILIVVAIFILSLSAATIINAVKNHKKK